MSVTGRFTGRIQVSGKLKQLAKPSVAKRIARKAMRESMKLVRDAAKLNAKSIDDPVTREKIWKNITMQTVRSSSNELKIRVGIRGGASQNQYTNTTALSGLPGGVTTYWRFIEFGTSEMAAQPFMRPALANNIDAVSSKFAQVFNIELDKELAKL